MVGETLAEAFPEKLCSVLVPALPSKGVRVCGLDIRARISDSSTFLQRNREAPVQSALAMVVTQLPSGKSLTPRANEGTLSPGV